MFHEIHMRRCLELAQLAKGHTSPNPMVGAVLVHNGRVIGEGWHHYYGADHAEVNCLNSVADGHKSLIRESTMYVNLEPCAHYGLTPPCANRLVAERVREVVIANTDPFKEVSGRGLEILRAGGIPGITGILEKEGAWMNRRFFCTHRQQRPYVILKWAQTGDGYIAPAARSRLQLTGKKSIELVHKWRTEEAAIMVGTNTAVNDDPQLTARDYIGRQPLRIAIDKDLKIPRTHKLYDDDAPTWIVNDHEEVQAGNIHFIRSSFGNGLLPQLLLRLYDAKILSVIVEGGAALLHSFIEAGLWDEARVFTAPVKLGDGIPAPILHNETEAFGNTIGNDHLQVYVNKSSAYPYIKGMAL